MSILEVLVATKAIIDTPEKWTKGAFAKDKNAISVHYSSESAVCFCLSGAIQKAAYMGGGDGSSDDPYCAIMEATREVGCCRGSVTGFNDYPETTHRMVMEVLDKAIANATVPTTGLGTQT